MMCVVTVVLLIWLLLGSLVCSCCACGYCNAGACGYCCAIGVIHTGAKSGGGSVTLFSDRWLLLLSVAIGVQHTEVPNLGVVIDAFFR